MDKSLIKETTEILKRLSPQNQAYFMTLLRIAEIAEDGARRDEQEKASNAASQKCTHSQSNRNHM